MVGSKCAHESYGSASCNHRTKRGKPHDVEPTKNLVDTFKRIRGGTTKFDAASHEEGSDDSMAMGVANVTLKVDMSTTVGISSMAHLVVGPTCHPGGDNSASTNCDFILTDKNVNSAPYEKAGEPSDKTIANTQNPRGGETLATPSP